MIPYEQVRLAKMDLETQIESRHRNGGVKQALSRFDEGSQSWTGGLS